MKQKVNVFWFRRDLRLHDNAGFYHALNSALPVLPLFIFDKNILGKLSSKTDARVTFIHKQLKTIKKELEKNGGSLKVIFETPQRAFQILLEQYEVNAVYSNKDYEPKTIKRDVEIQEFLKLKDIGFFSYKDHVIFEENDVLKDDGKPYTVFTPYSKKWKNRLVNHKIPNYHCEKLSGNLIQIPPFQFPELEEIGFLKSSIEVPQPDLSQQLIHKYSSNRDFPAVQGTSKSGVHLRFGTISIREITRKALELSEVFLNELIWRNFFIDILWHFPHVEDNSFKPKYDFITWRNDEKDFEKWCRGETGYPMVDAGMRELNETGFMHNRVRMVTAGFLVKHLLIDWRWGEAYFAEKLLDYELASNNGNWQWAAGCGCDAAPYFRVFNPETQQKKFDPKGEYIRKWIPEFDTLTYTKPIIEHKFARERVLKVYKEALR